MDEEVELGVVVVINQHWLDLDTLGLKTWRHGGPAQLGYRY